MQGDTRRETETLALRLSTATEIQPRISAKHRPSQVHCLRNDFRISEASNLGRMWKPPQKKKKKKKNLQPTISLNLFGIICPLKATELTLRYFMVDLMLFLKN